MQDDTRADNAKAYHVVVSKQENILVKKIVADDSLCNHCVGHCSLLEIRNEYTEWRENYSTFDTNHVASSVK